MNQSTSSSSVQQRLEPSTLSVLSVRVLDGSTGQTYKITLQPNELSVDHLRKQCGGFVPISEQIWLVGGPPYKVPRDVTLQSASLQQALLEGDALDEQWLQLKTAPQQQQEDKSPDGDSPTDGTAEFSPRQPLRMLTENKSANTAPGTGATNAYRLFLFSKRSLAEKRQQPKPGDEAELEIPLLQLPSEAPGQSPINITNSISNLSPDDPLIHAMIAYEKQIRLYCTQGQIIADQVDTIWEMYCCRVVQEQIALGFALQAATSNLEDHFANTAKTWTDFCSSFQQQTTTHTKVMQEFYSSTIPALQSTPLHPALVERSRKVALAASTAEAVSTSRLGASGTAPRKTGVWFDPTTSGGSTNTTYPVIGNNPLTTTKMSNSSSPGGTGSSSSQSASSSAAPGIGSTTTAPVQSALRPSSTSQYAKQMEYLIDTIPLEYEKALMQQCQVSHDRLQNMFQEIQTVMNSLLAANQHLPESSASPQQQKQGQQHEPPISKQRQLDMDLYRQIEDSWHECCIGRIRQLREDMNRAYMEPLLSQHQQAVQRILKLVQSETTTAQDLQNELTPLRETVQMMKDKLLPNMMENYQKWKEIVNQIHRQKQSVQAHTQQRLYEISQMQSSIQRVLQSVGVLKQAVVQQDAVIHQHFRNSLMKLPERNYEAFLAEIHRRRSYGYAVEAISNTLLEQLTSIRNTEVKARERFLRGPGRQLPPAFWEVFLPTMATPPPILAPQIPATAELDVLPDVSSAVLGTRRKTSISDKEEILSEQKDKSTDDQPKDDKDSGTGGPTGSANIFANQNQHDYVEETEGGTEDENDLILEPGKTAAGDANSAETEALLRTLQYENTLLRQQVERMGGRPPPTLLPTQLKLNPTKPEETTEVGTSADHGAVKADGANSNENESAESAAGDASPSEDVVSSLRKELEQIQFQAETTRKDLELAIADKKRNDKISHSSFAIGDVGLFMPTGRGSNGKRTYLAFHSRCPHRYLSNDCITGTPDFVLGRIVYQEELVAGQLGTDANPYGLNVGTKFWVLTVEVLRS